MNHIAITAVATALIAYFIAVSVNVVANEISRQIEAWRNERKEK